jgi:hypothetical protein
VRRGFDDADVEVLDKQQDGGAGVVAVDADVVEFSVVAQGDNSGLVDLVGAYAVVGVGGAVAHAPLGSRGVGPGGALGITVRQRDDEWLIIWKHNGDLIRVRYIDVWRSPWWNGRRTSCTQLERHAATCGPTGLIICRSWVRAPPAPRS